MNQMSEWKSVFIWWSTCCDHEKWLTTSCFHCSEYQYRGKYQHTVAVSICTTQTHTIQPLINGEKDQHESYYRGEIIQRVGIENYLETNTPHFLYSGLYVHIQFLSKTKLLRESINQSNMICPLFSKVNVCICLYKIDFKTISG